FFQRGARETETALGDIIADSMKWHVEHMDVDFAIQNGGGIRAPLAEGNITKASVHEILPFDNTVVVLTLKGTDVQKLFHHIAKVSGGSGAFPQVSDGIRFSIDREARRCKSIRINGKPIDLKRTYRIATNSYLAGGGDGYRIFLKAVERYDAAVLQRDVFIEYIKHLGGRIRPEIHHRIQIEGRSKPFRSSFNTIKGNIISGSPTVEIDPTMHPMPDLSTHRAGRGVIAGTGR
ncbi:MAG: 5'-nucleotidase C-terminal domain-containing protein, partial [Deltaproteobacteria bacterium]|nr:5'-nucleotidase C-terminal domain-containing protein [Deltaproteobacteria bacterium]